MDKILFPFKQGKLLNTLFLSNIFISFHYALIIYVNSSYLNNFFSETQVSTLYILGSIIDTVLLLYASKILEKIGNYKFIIYTVLIEFIATLVIAISNSPFFIGLFFLTHMVVISLIYFNMDIFIENVSKDESITGSVRATYMTIANITIFLSPLLVSAILINNNYFYVYLTSSIFMIPLYFFAKRFKKIGGVKVHHIKIKETILEYIKNSDLYNIFVSQFLLQFFYAYMIVYTPLYLTKYIGFSWQEVGIMFTIMLLPFVLLEIPVGELSDLKYGEKEFLTVGFIIIGLSTIFISFITAKVFWIWATALFITRIGASLVEASSESYFFKQVDKNKTDLISFFRISRPVSFIVAPLLATLALEFIPFQYIFIIIGSIMIVGAHYSLALKDTK
ncbi:MAG: MFS transporter [Minisyncoccia bacterium]